MLDVGTGTGILAILGALFGAERVSAMDIDRHAVEKAGLNAEASGVADRLELHCGGLERLNLAPPDVIVANLTPSVMVQLFDPMVRLLREDGFMVLAGFEGSSETASWITDQAERSAMHIEALFETQGWAGIVLQNGKRD
jgi:ribosomal protein L11 methyltransferase